MKQKNGISLIVLIVTIIVMLIIAGAVIISLSDTNIIDQAEKAKINWNIASIKEQLIMHNSLAETGINIKVKNGTLKEIGIDDVELNKKLLIQNGNIVYRPEYLNVKEIEQYSENGIEKGNYYAIVDSTSSKSNYEDITNVLTLEEFNKLSQEDKSESMICILEDLNGWQTIDTFNGAILGGENTINGVSNPIVNINNGEIKGLTLEGSITSTEMYISSFVIENNGLIYNCHSNVNITADGEAAGIVIYNNGIIINTSNKGNIESLGFAAAGLVLDNRGKIYTSFNSGNINVDTVDAGGIVFSQFGEMYNCYNTGSVNVVDEFAGRIAGIVTLIPHNRKTLTKNSYNLGVVTGIEPGAISNTYSDYVINCYSSNTACSRPFYEEFNENVKYWIEDLGTSTSEQKAQLLRNLNNGNSSKVWVEDTKNINNGYPILYWQAE